MAKQSINIQDGFLFQHLKAGTTVRLELTTGTSIEAVIRRFDKFALILDRQGTETLIYKHAVASIEALADQ
ncbi:MAG: RNA chaperone Hfq [Thermoanaerobaculia bacterium]|nr:RNA chaperone Hfq [Thermoanaerobaculia bacterium]